jgi:hypothetical protein
MLIIHAVQKLLNTSRLKASLYVSEPAVGQLMHSWYARLLSSTFPGKLFVMYVHEPSLLTVICRGKTIKGTWSEFLTRLPALMQRYNFPEAFIKTEMNEATGYVVAKTNSKSILAHMNQMIFQLEYDCVQFYSYDTITLELLEDRMMDNFYQTGNKEKPYTTPKDYWQQKL